MSSRGEPCFLAFHTPMGMDMGMSSSPTISLFRGMVGGGPVCSSNPPFPTPHSREGTFPLQGAERGSGVYGTEPQLPASAEGPGTVLCAVT